ncbi:MAG: histidine kinase, partial [Sulfurospirillaceae bacterium]|nr:histidine kinase [Sulfurospirillaceae bacterium]
DVMEAQEHIKPYALALSVVKSIINIFGQFDEPSIARSLELIDQYGFAREPFLQTVEQFKQ